MSQTRRKNDFLAEFAAFHCESAVQALAVTSPVGATFGITVDTKANMADADTVTLYANSHALATVYEYDKSADGVAAGHVTWAAGAGTAAQAAATLKTAINANNPEIHVVDNLDGTLTCSFLNLGALANQFTNAKSSSSALAVTNPSGGVDNAFAATLGATTIQKFMVVPRVFRALDVEWLTQTTVTQDATNYWDIELKDGSTSVAKWSTLTTAQGTITGGTGVTLVNSATDANLVFAAGDTMSLVLTKHGSPAALPPGRLTVHGHYVA